MSNFPRKFLGSGTRPSAVGPPRNPAFSDLDVAPLDRAPGDPMRRLLLARVARVGREGMVERLAVDVLRMRRKVVPHGGRKVVVSAVGHQNTAHRQLSYQ